MNAATPAQLLASAPLCKIISIAPGTGHMTLDINNLAYLPMSRNVGLIADPAAAQASIAAHQQQITLLPSGKTHAQYRHYSDWPVINIESDTSKTQLWYTPPKSGIPGAWRGNETRTCSNGRKWLSSIGPFIVDDFGTLVEVPQ